MFPVYVAAIFALISCSGNKNQKERKMETQKKAEYSGEVGKNPIVTSI